MQQDANFNVTAITNTSGAVLERYIYDPYGRSEVLTDSWMPKTGSAAFLGDYAFTQRFQGLRLDLITGNYNARNRDLNVKLSVWQQQDPMEYVDGVNLYQFVRSNPVAYTDPLGLYTPNLFQVPAGYRVVSAGPGGRVLAPIPQPPRFDGPQTQVMRGVWIDVVPKPDRGQHPEDDKKGQKKPGGKNDKGTDWPIWWSRFYSQNVCLLSHTVHSENVDDMISQIQEIAADDDISRLVIRAHGNPHGIFVGDGSGGDISINPQNVGKLEALKPYFDPDGIVILWVCDVGQNPKFMQQIADAVGVPVTAPDIGTGGAILHGIMESILPGHLPDPWVTVWPNKGPTTQPTR